MALWQIAHKSKPWEQWDDGETLSPGEEGFTTDAVRAHAAGSDFNYIGTPNWAAPAVDEPTNPQPE